MSYLHLSILYKSPFLSVELNKFEYTHAVEWPTTPSFRRLSQSLCSPFDYWYNPDLRYKYGQKAERPEKTVSDKSGKFGSDLDGEGVLVSLCWRGTASVWSGKVDGHGCLSSLSETLEIKMYVSKLKPSPILK